MQNKFAKQAVVFREIWEKVNIKPNNPAQLTEYESSFIDGLQMFFNILYSKPKEPKLALDKGYENYQVAKPEALLFNKDKVKVVYYPEFYKEEITVRCVRCGSTNCIKNGSANSSQRYKCKSCLYYFSKTNLPVKLFKNEVLALTLYLSGFTIEKIGQIIGVNTQTIMRWVRQSYHLYADAPQAMDIVEEVEVDELHYFLGKKNRFSGSKKCFVIRPKSFRGSNVMIVIQKP